MKYKLEIEEEEYGFEGWAFLHFHTLQPCYALANNLNGLYDYRLERMEDMSLEGVGWPLYRYEDTVGRMLFFLVERPAGAVDAPWDANDKVFLLKGENADTVARHILADFTERLDIDDGDLLAREHADLLEELLAEFTVVNLLDFESATSSRKAAKERVLVQDYCDKILAYIERKHLDLSEEEKWRIELMKGL